MINIVNGAKYNAKLSSQRALKLNEDSNKSRTVYLRFTFITAVQNTEFLKISVQEVAYFRDTNLERAA